VIGIVRLEDQANFAVVDKDTLQDDHPFAGNLDRISLSGTCLIQTGEFSLNPHALLGTTKHEKNVNREP